MALVALGERMCADQREAILVVLDLLNVDLPTLYRVATLAVSPKLAAMNVCMARGTLGAYLLEHHIGMALCAANLGVHAPQRVASLVVIKFGDGADRRPIRGGVTVLTRDGECPVGTCHFGTGHRTRLCRPRYRRRNLRILICRRSRKCRNRLDSYRQYWTYKVNKPASGHGIARLHSLLARRVTSKRPKQ